MPPLLPLLSLPPLSLPLLSRPLLVEPLSFPQSRWSARLGLPSDLHDDAFRGGSLWGSLALSAPLSAEFSPLSAEPPSLSGLPAESPPFGSPPESLATVPFWFVFWALPFLPFLAPFPPLPFLPPLPDPLPLSVPLLPVWPELSRPEAVPDPLLPEYPDPLPLSDPLLLPVPDP